jgi:hypothetical protein
MPVSGAIIICIVEENLRILFSAYQADFSG